MTDSPKIGFIGVGHMGHGMAANLLAKGYPLWVKANRNRVPVEDLVAKGAHEALDARKMAEVCDIVLLCLSNSPQVEEIVRGPDGLLASGKPGLIVIDCTTADPRSTRSLASELDAAGMIMVDAPLGRTPKEAAAGTLDAMVGCTPETFAQIQPVLACWAANINHIGPVGSAHTMKLIMNFIGMSYGALYSEALVMGAKNGVSPQTIQKVIGSSRLSNGMFDTFMQYAVGRDPNAQLFSMDNALKDMRYGAEMAIASGVSNQIGSAVLGYYQTAVAQGKGDDNMPQLSDHVAALNGLDLARIVAGDQSDA